MSDDQVMDRIDATIEGLCACGCGTPLRVDGPSAYWATDRCMTVWQGSRTTEPEQVYERLDAHLQYIPPVEFPLPAQYPDPEGRFGRGRWAQEQARLAAAREQQRRLAQSRLLARWEEEGSQPSSSTLAELREAMVEHLRAVMDDPERASWADRDPRFVQRPAWPQELLGQVLTEMQLASSDGRRWQIRPGRDARAEISFNREASPDVMRLGRRDWLEVDQQQTTVTVTWMGPWELRISESGSDSDASELG